MNAHLPERIKLGGSDLSVSPLGIGTNSWGIGRQADSGVSSMIDAALDLGINWFDTAEVYGLGGSERTLGLFLPGLGEKVVVTTKFFPMPWRLGKTDLIRALQASLERLKINRVDLYLIHFPVPPVSIESWMEAMAEAKNASLLRAVGVSNFNAEQTRRAHAALAKFDIPLACNQVEYNLLKRGAERNGLLEVCRELDVALVAYHPIASGLLTGKYSPGFKRAGPRSRYFSPSYLQRIAPLLGQLQEIGRVRGRSPSQVALNWIICKGALPIPGAKNARHAVENAGALGWRLGEGEISALDQASDKLNR
ncbi:MAG: aldo/keto reductase [Anaerolineales bacterium]|jgi:aryl-alcohol dehydrogenase-like predicted oxidoreductase